MCTRKRWDSNRRRYGRTRNAAFSERGYGGMTSKEWRRVTLHRKCLLRVCYQFLYTELDKTLTCIAQKCSHLFWRHFSLWVQGRPHIKIMVNRTVILTTMCTGFSSEIGTKLRESAVGQARGSCYSWAALSSNDSKTLYWCKRWICNLLTLCLPLFLWLISSHVLLEVLAVGAPYVAPRCATDPDL